MTRQQVIDNLKTHRQKLAEMLVRHPVEIEAEVDGQPWRVVLDQPSDIDRAIGRLQS